MRLEEAIKVKSFRNEYQKAIINLYFTNSILSHQFKQRLKPYGITSQQFNILRIVKGQYPNAVRVGVIKERMIEQNSDITRLVERLHNKGLLKRVVCEEDKRQQHVTITEKGLNLLQITKEVVINFEEYNTDMTLAELRELNRLLDKLRSGYTDKE